MGPYPPEVDLARHTNSSQSEIGRWGWGFHTVREDISTDGIRVGLRVVGVVDVWMDSDSGMRPYRARVTLTLCMNPGQ